MVSMISSIVEEILVIAGLSLFMEVMLPSGTLKKYSQFVMGLLVIVAVLNPLINFFGGDLSQVQMSSWQIENYDDDTALIVSAGQDLALDLEMAASNVAEETLEKQIRSMVKLVDGVSDVAVDLVLLDEELVELQVLLTLVTDSVEILAESDEDKLLSAAQIADIKSDVLDVITSFFDIDPDKVQISLVEVADS